MQYIKKRNKTMQCKILYVYYALCRAVIGDIADIDFILCYSSCLDKKLYKAIYEGNINGIYVSYLHYIVFPDSLM